MSLIVRLLGSKVGYAGGIWRKELYHRNQRENEFKWYNALKMSIMALITPL